MIPTIYRFDDANAPVLGGVAGSMAGLLAACLVDGYGDRQPAGWSLEHLAADNSRLLLRNNTSAGGLGFFLDLEDSAATTFTAAGYEVMSAPDQPGLGPFAAAPLSFYKSNASGTAPRRWLMLADQRIFYLFIHTHSAVGTDLGAITASCTVLCFGDFIPARDEGYNGLLAKGESYRISNNLSSAATTGLTGRPGAFGGAGNDSLLAPRALSGAVAASGVNLCLVSGGGPVGWVAIGSSSSYGTYNQIGEPYNGVLRLSRPCLADGGAQVLRGWLPGLYHIAHPPEDFDFLATISVEGRNFQVIRIHGTTSNTAYFSSSLLAFETGVDWWA